MQPSPIPGFAPPSNARLCLHCGQAVAKNRDSNFCCGGCESVYGIVKQNDLGRYYELEEKLGSGLKGPCPVFDRDSFSYLDEPAFKTSYAKSNGTVMQFHLEGVHCAACIWLIEKVPTLVPGIKNVTLNLSSSIATVEIKPGGRFAPSAEEFQRLGYRPHPVELGQVSDLQRKAGRLNLLQLGVAGACSGNIMLLAIANYSGTGPEFATPFRWVSLALFLPVLFFSARSFFENAGRSVGRKKISIDVPIAIGISVGSIVSIWSVLSGSGEVYFDSLSGLIFLLLSSRYFLNRVQARAANATQLIHFLVPSRAKVRESNGTIREVKSESLLVGQTVEVLPGELFPADGKIIMGLSTISQSWLTGETASKSVGPGSEIVAGALNESSWVTFEVSASGAATRLAEIFRKTQMALKSQSNVIVIADRMAAIFVPATLVLVGLGFFFRLSYRNSRRSSSCDGSGDRRMSLRACARHSSRHEFVNWETREARSFGARRGRP
jgi:Cu2+-exporting ATPase